MPTRTNPTDRDAQPELEDVVAAMARVVFQSGMGARVVDAKWADIEAAFGGFEPDNTAGLTPSDVDRLCSDPRVIRNRSKLESIIHNARVLSDWERDTGVRAHLDELESDADRASEVIRRLKFVGPAGAHEFLWRIDAIDELECGQ